MRHMWGEAGCKCWEGEKCMCEGVCTVKVWGGERDWGV